MKHPTIEHLNRIADKNNDEFEYTLVFENRGDGRWGFQCDESAEGHGFIGSFGETPDEALNQITERDIRNACKHWSYKYVK